MRPVNKGDTPNIKFKEYSDAEPYLEERLGAYCSYCEFPIAHVPEVEHKISKSKDGNLLAWDNLLLSCKYCNTRKSDIIESGNKSLYIWPDEDNTFKAFTYQEGKPRVNEYCDDQETRSKATNLYNLINLGNIPQKPKDKDKRFDKRNETYNHAKECKEDWKIVKDTSTRDAYRRAILKAALAEGFFSVWMEVFKEEPVICKDLVEAFPGTVKKYCLV